jgi:pSer/pThr/pTyr-binding forkhead associated (FHA) protein
MNWALKVKQGKRKGMIILIQKSPFLIGRNVECQLRPASPYVSDRHCELLIEGDQLVVRDCNSTNGTFINSQRIQGRAELHEGDHLKASSLTFVVCLEELKSIEERHLEPESPKLHESVEEDSVEDILLNLDEEDPSPGPVAWRKTWDEDTNSVLDHAREKTAEKSKPGNKPGLGPADVANALLKGHGSLLKKRY